jgi:hypothetical protein
MYEITYAKPAGAYLEVLAERVKDLTHWVTKTKPTSTDPDDNDGGKEVMRDYMHSTYKIRLDEARRNLRLAKKMLL